MTGGSHEDGPPKRRKSRGLAPEDASLWHHIARSITPLHRAKGRVPDVELEPQDTARTPRKALGPDHLSPPKTPAGKGKSRPVSAPAKTPVSIRPPAPQASLERRQARRIAAGTIEIEARLDLHGLTLSAAHDRLVGFLQNAAASGLKTVLVITGKGGRRRFLAMGWGQADGDIGVLKSSVPRWLAEPPLRALVVGYQSAAVQHGGDGALYVQVRRQRTR